MPAETGAIACINGRDDDGDLLKDCDDSDCWGFAYCRVTGDAGTSLEPVPPFIPEPPGGPVGPPPNAITDGSVPVEMPMTQDADMPPVVDVRDAAVDAEAPLLCDERCPEGECNADGTCNVPLILGNYDIATLEVLAPRRYLHTENNELVCFDDLGTCLLADPFTGCCAPDPTVYVSVQGKKAGTIRDDEAAFKVWQATGIKLQLHEGDEVLFDVLDDDGEDEAGDAVFQALFSCTTTVTVDAIAAGRINCEPDDEDVDDDPPIGLRYHVTATLERLAGDLLADEQGDMDMP